eukprot:60328_1
MSQKNVLVGNRRIVLSELHEAACVAYGSEDDRVAVTLDKAQLKRLKEACERFDDSKEEESAEDINGASVVEGVTEWMSERDVRAVIFAKLVSLMHIPTHGTPVRPAVCEYLSTLLNERIFLKLPLAADSVVMRVLADVVCGNGGAFKGSEEIELSTVIGTFPGLSSSERAQFVSGLVASMACGALVVRDARILLDTADAVGALSCECARSNTQCFDPARMNERRPNKGAVQVCTNMRVLLEDSRLAAPESPTECAPALRATPDSHGTAREVCAAARLRLIVEMNAVPDGGACEGVRAESLVLTLRNLASASLLIAESSRQRLLLLPSASEMDVYLDGMLVEAKKLLSSASPVPESAASSLCAAVRAAAALLSVEAAAAAKELDRQQKQKTEEVEANMRAKEARGAQFGKQTEKKDPTEKQRKKMEKAAEKRRKQLEKKSLLGIGKQTSIFNKTLCESSIDGQSLLSWADSQSVKSQLDFFRANSAALFPLSRPSFALSVRSLIEATRSFRAPRVAKGTRDTTPARMVIRERAFRAITDVFHRHGAVGIDTPVFELRDTLTGKYGEDSKLIYDLADQGGESLSLRYDLTVPFARYVGMNRVGSVKRYHIAKVYRRDQPVVTKGKFREFYQCDYDIAGNFDSMIPDADVLSVVCEILDSLNLGGYVIKLNHRMLLDAIMEISGVPPTKFRTICSAIDKLDKLSWEQVKEEMVSEKGLAPEVADRIWQFVQLKDAPPALLARLQSDEGFANLRAHTSGGRALADLELLFRYLGCLGCLERCSFDLSLARGLDYYTGVIFEGVLTEYGGGSITGGGRYDGLIGTFSSQPIPAVGMSIGIERILAILEVKAKKKAGEGRQNHTQVVVGSNGAGLLSERMELCAELWKAGIAAEFVYKQNPKTQAQIDSALNMKCPFMVFIDPKRLEEGTVEVKDLSAKTKEDVTRADLIEYLKNILKV